MFWAASTAHPAPHDDFWYADHPVMMPNGTYTMPNAAVRYPAVYGCVRAISEALMSLPLVMYERKENDGREKARGHALYGLLHDRPTHNMTSAEWIDVMLWHLLLRGNFYAYKGRSDKVTELPILHPDKVRMVRLEGFDDDYGYEYTDKDGKLHRYLRSEVMHIRGPSDDGVMGLNPIELNNTTAATALAQSDFTRRFYENDARPGGWIEYPGHFRKDEDRREFRESWQAAQGGKNRHKTAVLEFGMKYHALDMKLSDAQFLESKKYTNHDIARIFRVPPHKIGELDRATHTNIEHQAIEFRQDTILPWATRIERRLGMELLNDEERDKYYFEFMLDGLERGDSAARAEMYHYAITDGWKTRNEVRKSENLPPLDGLDEPLTPLNMDRTGSEEPDEPSGTTERREQRGRRALIHNAHSCARREAQTLRAITRKHEGDELVSAAQEFYESFGKVLTRSLQITDEEAAGYIAESIKQDWGDLAHWEADNVPRLLELVV